MVVANFLDPFISELEHFSSESFQDSPITIKRALKQ